MAKRVMIVDDNCDASEIMELVLGILGHTTVTAHSGADALVLVENFHPDVALIDLCMPGMSGFELALALQSRTDFSDLVLIALTGMNDAVTIEKVHAMGFWMHIPKPAGLDQLKQAIGR